MIHLNIAIDDVNPKKGYRILGEEPEKWLRQLNEEFGVKFTLFCPTNYHGQHRISQDKQWIQELDSISWAEIAAHGNLHQTSNPQQYGECEFFELQNEAKINERYDSMLCEWLDAGIRPQGFRPPGWLCSPEMNRKLNSSSWFKYVAVHSEHNRGLIWPNRTVFFGHDGIHQEHITIHNVNEANPEGMIMFQSHIAGDHNDNVWNEQNYEQLKLSLTHLFEQYQPIPKLLRECV